MSKKTTRPFTIILDDLVRSPLINAGEFRLYSFLLSYCTKAVGAEKTISLPKTAMAGELRISVSGVTKQLRKLESLGLITISYIAPQKPIYTLNTSPPESICPEAFKGRKWKSALAHIKASGGVKKLQTKTNKVPTKKQRRTGWPASKPGVPEDDGGQPQPHQQVSPTASTHTLQSMGSTQDSDPNPYTPVHGVIHSSPWGHTLESMGSDQTHTLQSIPVQSKEENSLRVPYGIPPSGGSRALARPKGVSRTTLMMEPENLDPGAVRQTDIKNPEEPSVPESEEQRLERLERQRKIKFGQLDFGFGPKAKSDGGSEDKPRPKRRGAGPPPSGPGSASDQRSTEEHEDSMTNSSEAVTVAPSAPWPLYAFFKKAVFKKYPNAHLGGHDTKYLGWGKRLLKVYTTEQLYEMMLVLIMDFENFKTAKVFMKNSGTPAPNYEQFYANAPLLVGLIGRGVVSPPAVRRSPYAEDYARRHNAADSAGSEVEDSVDPIQALRDQYNRTIE